MSFPSLGGGKPAKGCNARMPVAGVAQGWGGGAGASANAGSVGGVGGWSTAVKRQPSPGLSAASEAVAAAPAPPKEFKTSLTDFPSLGAPQTLQGPRGREELIRRNKALMSMLLAELQQQGRPADEIGKFKEASLSFQRGEIDAAAYLDSFLALFGKDATVRLFAEVADLLPDETKRVALLNTFETFAECVRREQLSQQRPPRGGRGRGWAHAAQPAQRPSWMYAG